MRIIFKRKLLNDTQFGILSRKRVRIVNFGVKITVKLFLTNEYK